MKYFEVSTGMVPVDKDVLMKTALENQQRSLSVIQQLKKLQESYPLPHLTHTHGRIVLRVNPSQKNFHTLQTGQEIALERDVENLDRAYTQQVLGECISGEGVPKGAAVLFHFNALHDVNTVFDLNSQLSGDEIAAGIKILSLPASECFMWNIGEGWQPIYPYVHILRVYEPYSGLLQGIEPTELKNTFYVLSGDLKGRVVRTVANAAYRIIFRNEQGVEETFLRCRHYSEDDVLEEEYDSRQDIMAIDDTATGRVLSGDLLVGITAKDAKSIL